MTDEDINIVPCCSGRDRDQAARRGLKNPRSKQASKPLVEEKGEAVRRNLRICS